MEASYTSTEGGNACSGSSQTPPIQSHSTLPSFKIRHIEISPPLILSPMSGVTTSPFRRLIKDLNSNSIGPNYVGLVVSEFISVEGLTRKGKRSVEMMKFHPSERPYCIQIFGFDPKRMADAARMVQDAGADIVDINCGCPAPKVVRKGGGCELMRNPDHLKIIIREIKKAVSIPVTLKMRSGWDESSKNAKDLAKLVIEEGIEGIAIHGRTRQQMYRGEADWSHAIELANELRSKYPNIPISGSGDIIDHTSALNRLSSGVSGLYIGRASISNPFIFSEITTRKKYLLRENPIHAKEIINKYIELLLEDFTEIPALGKVKQLASQMLRGLEWRKELLVAGSLGEVRKVLGE